MIQFIIGEKGKGKTKVLLEKANREVKEATGNVVYLDKNTQHMFELNNKIRLIDVTNYPLTDADEFIGATVFYSLMHHAECPQQVFVISVRENDVFTA